MSGRAGAERLRIWRLADWALDRLSDVKSIAGFWAIYVVAFAALRLGRSTFLTLDDAISEEVTQRVLLPLYSVRNPPLYEWFLWAVQHFLGPGIGGHLVLRSVLIFLIGIVTYDTVRSLSADRRVAAAASLGLLSLFAFAWQVHIALTQSLFVFLCLLLLIRLLDSFCRKPGFGRALCLGLTIGFGILAKWSFVLAAVAGLIVLLLDSRARRAGIGYLAVTFAAALLPLAPTAIYFINAHADLVTTSERVLLGNSTQPHVVRVLQGLAGVVVKTAAFFVPFVLFAGAAFVRLRHFPRYRERDASAELVSRFILVQALVLFAAILVAGIANVTERYVYTLAVPMMIAFYLSVAVTPVRDTVLRFVVNGAFISLAVVLAIKFFLLVEAMVPGGRVVTEVLPFPALARELKARGYEKAGIIAPDRQLAGNLMELLPQAAVISTGSERLIRPGTYDPHQRCIVIWEVEPRLRGLPGMLEPAIVKSAQRLEVVGTNGGIGAMRRGVWKLVDLGEGADICRREIGTSAM
jgi:hypothetical protein